ncbi:hypothetical protein RHI9324_00476 [Rhizobium sp. CECT 9324]|nr:hypothetical protein RHI9324_00476 [Rhizobium sp. CECT 9324]
MNPVQFDHIAGSYRVMYRISKHRYVKNCARDDSAYGANAARARVTGGQTV